MSYRIPARIMQNKLLCFGLQCSSREQQSVPALQCPSYLQANIWTANLNPERRITNAVSQEENIDILVMQ